MVAVGLAGAEHIGPSPRTSSGGRTLLRRPDCDSAPNIDAPSGVKNAAPIHIAVYRAKWVSPSRPSGRRLSSDAADDRIVWCWLDGNRLLSESVEQQSPSI